MDGQLSRLICGVRLVDIEGQLQVRLLHHGIEILRIDADTGSLLQGELVTATLQIGEYQQGERQLDVATGIAGGRSILDVDALFGRHGGFVVGDRHGWVSNFRG